MVCCWRWIAMNSKIEKKNLENELKVAENNLLRQKKFRDDEKQKRLSLDKNTGKIITGKTEIRPGEPTKIDNTELISAIVKIAVTDFAVHEHQCFEVIPTVKTLDELTSALHDEEFQFRRFSVY